MNEFYNPSIDLKIILDEQNKAVTLTVVSTGASQVFELLEEDFTEIVQLSTLPVFGWGNVMLKIAIAITKKVGAGSDAK